MKNNKISVQSMALLALLVAIQIVLSRQFAIETQLVKFSFAFVATFLMGLFLGPWWAGIGGVLSDVVGMSLLAKSPFFIGFTFSAFLGGVVYGLYFYNKEVTLKRCIACVLTNTVLFTLILNANLVIHYVQYSIKQLGYLVRSLNEISDYCAIANRYFIYCR